MLWLLSAGGWLKSAASAALGIAAKYPRTSATIAVCTLALLAHWWDVNRKLDARDALWKGRIAAAQQTHREVVAGYVVDMSQRATETAARRAAEQGRIQTETKILKEVIREYITPLAVSRCIVSRGFVLHHDAAWSGAALPAPTSGLVDADSGIPLDRVADANADNAGTCRQLASEVRLWRDWYPAEAAAHARMAREAQGESPAVPQPATKTATKGR